MFDVANEVVEAEKIIRSYVRETPLDYSVPLSKITNCNVYLKCENLQHTGSFKVRGAINKLLSLTHSERKQGVVTASTGNHGAAVAYGLNQLKINGLIFVPENTSPAKIENIRNYNVALEFYGTDCIQSEMHALYYAVENNMIYVSPYNDLDVIAGQGSIGVELARQLNKIDVVLVPVGGGGMIAGIAGFLKSISPNTKIIGCMPENSPVMYESIKAGVIVEMETMPTLSDATAGGIEKGAVTFELCQQYVDDYILVSEQEIQNAIVSMLRFQHQLIEGAAGVALASLIKHAEQFQGKNVVVILCGANISLDTLNTVLKSSA